MDALKFVPASFFRPSSEFRDRSTVACADVFAMVTTVGKFWGCSEIQLAFFLHSLLHLEVSELLPIFNSLHYSVQGTSISLNLVRAL